MQLINDNFYLASAKPLDGRTLVEDSAALFAIPWYYRYPGMQVYVKSVYIWFFFEGDSDTDFTDNSYWEPLGSGGGASEDALYDTLLPDALQMAERQGGLAQGTPVSELKGDTIISVLDRFLFPNVIPDYVLPEATLTGSDPKLFQVSDIRTISLNAAYIQRDGGVITGYKLVKDGIELAVAQIYSDTGVVKNIPGTVKYRARFTYGEGDVNTDTYGNPVLPPLPAGTVQSSPEIVYEWIYPYFFGITTTPGSIDPGTASPVLAKVGTQITVSFNSPDENTFLWFAVPTGTPVFTGWEVTESNFGGIGGTTNLFGNPTVVQVSKGNFSNIDYDLYVSNYGSDINTPMKLIL